MVYVTLFSIWITVKFSRKSLFNARNASNSVGVHGLILSNEVATGIISQETQTTWLSKPKNPGRARPNSLSGFVVVSGLHAQETNNISYFIITF